MYPYSIAVNDNVQLHCVVTVRGLGLHVNEAR